MYPIKLTLQGMYSYRESVTIDFDKLMTARIFGIFGAVGSGKSTIIEAILLVLYGKSDRLNENKNFNIINLNSREIKIEYTFVHADNTYLFTYENKKQKKDPNVVGTPIRKAYQIINNDKIPLTSINAEDILGIGYEEFIKIVILPQGSFAEFINLKDSERGVMITKLFNLQDYDLTDRVRIAITNNTHEIKSVQGEQLGLSIASQEEYDAWIVLLKDYNQKSQEATTKLEATTKQLKDSEVAQKNHLHLIELQEKKSHLQSQKEIIDNDKKTLHKHRIYVEYVKTDYLSMLNTEKKYNHLKNQIEIKSNKHKSLDDGLKKLNTEAASIIATYGDDASRKRNIEVLEKGLKIVNLQEQIIPLANKKEHIGLQLQQINKQVDEWKNILNKLEKEQTILFQSFEEEEHLTSFKNISNDIINKQNNIQLLATDSQKLQTKIDNINEIKNAIKQQHFPENFEEWKSSELIRQLNVSLSTHSEKISQLELKIKTKIQEESLETFAEQLIDGEPCPLCGSENHPFIYHKKNQSNELLSLENELNLLRNQYHEIDKNIASLNREINEYKIIHQEQITNSTSLDKLNSELQDLENKLKAFPQSWELNLVTEQLNNISNNKKTFAQNNKTIQEIAAKINENVPEKIEQEFNNIEIEIVKIKSIIDDLTIEIDDDILSSNKENLNKKLTENINANLRAEALQVEIKSASQSIAIIEAELKMLNEEYHIQLKEYEELNKKIDAICDEKNIERTSIATLSEQQIDVTLIEERINNYERNLSHTIVTIESLNAALSEHPYSEELHNELNSKIQEYSNIILVATEQITTLKLRIEDNKLRKEKFETLQQQFHNLKVKEDNLKVLAELFRGKGFVNYASQQYLRQLFALANVRFLKMTNNRLKLVYDESGKFLVQDFLNDGATRSIKTLSGGQTFQASLSLALALSELLQLFHKHKQHFFFLDEGFGSLDVASLHIVMDTLRSLQQEQRCVGIISHIEEMKQDMEYFITVENTAERGSVITPSYI